MVNAFLGGFHEIYFGKRLVPHLAHSTCTATGKLAAPQSVLDFIGERDIWTQHPSGRFHVIWDRA